MAVYMLAKPVSVPTAGPFVALKWRRSLSWLETVRADSNDGDRLQKCSAWEQPLAGNRTLTTEIRSFAAGVPANVPSLLLADIQVTHLKPEGGSAKLVRLLTCAFFGLVRQMMSRIRGSSLVLNFGSEWASWSFVNALDRLLGSCGIDPTAAILLHINPGMMLSLEEQYSRRLWAPLRRWASNHLRPLVAPPPAGAPRLRQAYWQQYWYEILEQQATSSEISQYLKRYHVCGDADARQGLWTRMTSRANDASTLRDAFLLLGGQARTDRGQVFLELLRRGLLRHARWSSARFAFCSEANDAALEQFVASGPFAEAEARALLQGSGRAELCAQLPKLLDVDPTNRAQSELAAKRGLWAGTHFALTFETSMPTAELIMEERLLFATEKPLKPIQALRPFVMLGTVGSLAILRALGFRTSFGLNASYDMVMGGAARVHSAIDQMAQLLSVPPAGRTRALQDALHNQAHLLCGGVRGQLRQHALHALETAAGIGASRSAPK